MIAASTYGDVDVLDDDVGSTSTDGETLPTDHARVTDANNGFVAGNLNERASGVVPRCLDALFVIITRVLDGILATSISAAPVDATASMASRSALGADEVELLVNEDDARRGVGEPGNESST